MLQMLYASLDVIIAELIGVLTFMMMNYHLANKNKNGWLWYAFSSIFLVYVLYHKHSWISVINQSMMIVLGIKNYYLFHQPNHQYHPIFNRISIAVFLFSLLFINGLDGKSLSELLLWVFIIARTIFLGKNHISGWIFQIIQTIISIVFGWYRNMYFYILVGIIFLFQSVLGYWKWKK